MKSTARAILRIVLLGVTGMCLAGALSLSCRPQTPSGPTLYRTAADLKPDASPGERAVLIFFGSDIGVDVERNLAGADLELKLTVLGEEIESERYRSEESRFMLVQAASERFESPLPLLEFPVTEGQTLTWKGRLYIGEIGKDATATTLITKDNLNEKGFSGEAIKSAVELQFDGGGPKPTVRTLTFWFVPSKGIVKRSFDKGSTRVPAPPPGAEPGDSD